MATQAVSTILSTRGGAERLDTSTAERVARQASQRKFAEAQDLVARQRQQLANLDKVQSSELPVRLKRKIQSGVEQLRDEIRTGQLDESY